MAWAWVWDFLIDQFQKVIEIFFVRFTPLGAGISIGAFIFGITILHKIIDLLVPFAGGRQEVTIKYEKPTAQEREQYNYWNFRGG